MCVVHDGGMCRVPHGADGAVGMSAGFSCKTVSPLSNRKGADSSNTIKHEVGSTGGTFKALHLTNLEHPTPFQWLENVPQLLNASSTNWSTIVDMYNDAGYSIRVA